MMNQHIVPGTQSSVMRVGVVITALAVFSLVVAGCQPHAPDETGKTEPHVMAGTPVDAGRYLVIMGGCNDCHTEGYMESSQGDIPEQSWLTGSIVGFRGPWGTTYPQNLRLRAQEWSEDVWVATVHTRKALPPMPWINVNQMSEQDARAVYRYIRSLGPAGEHKPAALPPDQEPQTPYISFAPLNLPAEL